MHVVAELPAWRKIPRYILGITAVIYSTRVQRVAFKGAHQHRDTRTTAAYRVVWPQPLGRRSSVFRMQHVEQTYLVRVLLTLRKKEKQKSVSETSGSFKTVVHS